MASPPEYPKLPPKLILTSTKAYFSPERTIQYLTELLDPKNGILPIPNDDILFGLIPDFLSIYPCSSLLESFSQKSNRDASDNTSTSSSTAIDPSSWPLQLGAQDAFWSHEYGAFTGEIVPPALHSLGIRIVELGHAERRKLLSETDVTTAHKAAAVCACGMVPLVCIGETEQPDLSTISTSAADENGNDKAAAMTKVVDKAMDQLTPQITSVLAAVPDHAPVIFAYEPVWAIGAAHPAGVEYVGPVVQAIRAVVANAKLRAGQTRIVYGGSAGPGLWSGSSNGGRPLSEWVDGMFLGRFAHEIEGVKNVVDEFVESLK